MKIEDISSMVTGDTALQCVHAMMVKMVDVVCTLTGCSRVTAVAYCDGLTLRLSRSDGVTAVGMCYRDQEQWFAPPHLPRAFVEYAAEVAACLQKISCGSVVIILE